MSKSFKLQTLFFSFCISLNLFSKPDTIKPNPKYEKKLNAAFELAFAAMEKRLAVLDRCVLDAENKLMFNYEDESNKQALDDAVSAWEAAWDDAILAWWYFDKRIDNPWDLCLYKRAWMNAYTRQSIRNNGTPPNFEANHDARKEVLTGLALLVVKPVGKNVGLELQECCWDANWNGEDNPFSVITLTKEHAEKHPAFIPVVFAAFFMNHCSAEIVREQYENAKGVKEKLKELEKLEELKRIKKKELINNLGIGAVVVTILAGLWAYFKKPNKIDVKAPLKDQVETPYKPLSEE